MRKSKELVHEGKYTAEIAVDLVEGDTAWSPYLSPIDHARPRDLCGARIGLLEPGDKGNIFANCFRVFAEGVWRICPEGVELLA